MEKKYIMMLWVAVIFAVILIGIIYVSLTEIKQPEYRISTPEEVVRQYFTSWNNKDYPNMYATISDGFKKIDPYVKSLESFRQYANAQNIERIDILSIKEAFNDGMAAMVDYSVEFTLINGAKSRINDRFTLKFRQGDIIPGWKLIHPYGDNIDIL